jgi:hypothetical protein
MQGLTRATMQGRHYASMSSTAIKVGLLNFLADETPVGK